ncbi:MAG: PadR family transcriptional regulator [Gammaproteobacteria bacterium]|nr:PadR family transcriptional regulator [Gammaproteobacteria bacterium]
MRERSRTKYIILGMLTIDDMSGYDISKAIKSSTHHFWAESEGQLYPALAACVKLGWAKCKEAAADSKRAKKIYSITASGKKELAAWLKKEPQEALVRNELLLKLFFGRNVAKLDNLQHIAHQQQRLEAELGTYSAMREELIKRHGNSPHLQYWLITLDYGLKSAKAELAWCKDTIKILNNK